MPRNKRMFAHDYTRVGFYMITILTAGRRRMFGVCRNNRVELSRAGKIVQRRWMDIPRHRPAVETNTLTVMPDHIHGIVYVREKLPKPVGDTIRGFKSGVTSELRKVLVKPDLSVWEEGYHDRVVMNAATLRTERRYIRDNPRRYCVRKANPDLFARVNRLDGPRLPADTDWAGFGNLYLLNKASFSQIRVSRSAAPDEIAACKREAARQSWRGTVMVSPFISPGEKAVAEHVMKQDYGSLILLKPDGFAPFYKPSGFYFDLCAQGRLLVLSPFAYSGRRRMLSRKRCLQLNRWAAGLCGDHTCGKNAAAQ